MIKSTQKLQRLFKERIGILDGAMGTQLQLLDLQEADYRGERFRDHPDSLKGNHDLLVLTRPDAIQAVHEAYLAAGADIISTNTFSATSIAQADYHTSHLAYELNKTATQIACRAAQAFSTAEKPRWVAGAMGPTNRTPSISPEVNRPGFRNITFQALAEAYEEAVKGLVEGGVDILLIETVFDTLNFKAALCAVQKYFEEHPALEPLPLIVSGTITDQSGRTLSGQTLEAFWASIRHANLFAVCLNCALGPKELRPYVEELSRIADIFVGVYPNAGLPNAFGGYDESPETMAKIIHEFAAKGWLNFVGGFFVT